MSATLSATGAPIVSNSNRLLADWKEAAAQLAAIKATEATLRAAVIEAFSKETDPLKSGVENVDIGWGHKLKVTHKLDYKLDTADDQAKLDAVLDEIERNTEGGKIIAERLVKYDPRLAVAEYKLLSPANKARIDKVLTVKAAAKSVELIAPKA